MPGPHGRQETTVRGTAESVLADTPFTMYGMCVTCILATPG
jgi:hypothetical protein